MIIDIKLKYRKHKCVIKLLFANNSLEVIRQENIKIEYIFSSIFLILFILKDSTHQKILRKQYHDHIKAALLLPALYILKDVSSRIFFTSFCA